MKPLFGQAGVADLGRLNAGRALVALDFDGTLGPLHPRRERAALRPRTRRLLIHVARLYPCAILSGRVRADLSRRLAGIPLRWLVGNHGAESGGTRVRTARQRRRVRSWLRALQPLVAQWPGLEVEDKGLSLAFHTRHVARPREAQDSLLRAARALAGVRVRPGKGVVELVSHELPHKGEALAQLVKRARANYVFFAGDDETDEDVFAMDLGVPAVTVRIGRRRGSRAQYWLENQVAVDQLLETLIALRDPGRARA
jgi:trehalose 6-phosphate phosphatase